MTKKSTLLIVESPAKAKTIEHYLGKGYSVDLLKNLYDCFNSDFYGLRTQNPKMAKAM